jgi:hypothetical protein
MKLGHQTFFAKTKRYLAKLKPAKVIKVLDLIWDEIWTINRVNKKNQNTMS